MDVSIKNLKTWSPPEWFAPVGLLALTLLAYFNSFPGNFIGDDISIVKLNPLVSNIDLKLVFTTDYWGRDVNSGLFRPLTILSFGLNRLFLGDSATAFHAVNFLLHALVSVMLYLTLKRFVAISKVAWLTAAIFAVHPIHTEVVNEMVGRAELLSALALLMSIWAWTLQRKLFGWPVMILAFLAGLLSKENAIVLLGLLPVLEFFSEQLTTGVWRKKVFPYLLLCLVSLCWLGSGPWGVVRTVPPDGYDHIYTPLASLPLDQRLLTALKYQWLYLRKLLLPYDLQGIYSGRDFFQPVTGQFSPEGGLIVLAGGLFLSAVFWLFLKRDLVGLGLLFYLVAITPIANLFFVSGVTFAERLTYLPSIGFSLALAATVETLTTRLSLRWTLTTRTSVLVFFLVLTMLRNPDFGSALSLWQEDVRRDPANVLALMYLANTYAEIDRFSEADNTFQVMVDQAPDFYEGLRNYAVFLFDRGQFDKAISLALQVANSSKEQYPTNYLLLGQAYVKIGDYRRALYWLDLTPRPYQQYGIYWEYRGRALEGVGSVAEAIGSYRRMGGYPAGSDIPLRLGRLLLQNGKPVEAILVLKDVVQRNKSSASGWNSLGVAHAMVGDSALAREAFGQAVRLDPENSSYQDNLQRASRK